MNKYLYSIYNGATFPARQHAPRLGTRGRLPRGVVAVACHGRRATEQKHIVGRAGLYHDGYLIYHICLSNTIILIGGVTST